MNSKLEGSVGGLTSRPPAVLLVFILLIKSNQIFSYSKKLELIIRIRMPNKKYSIGLTVESDTYIYKMTILESQK